MAFGNPILAGEELIRSAIRSEDFDDGQTSGTQSGWRIARDGSATFSGAVSSPAVSADVLSAKNSFLYKGDELSKLLDAKSPGIIAFGQYQGILPNPTTSTEFAFLLLSADLIAGRQYEIVVTKIQISGSTNAGIMLRYSFNTTPTLTSTKIRYETVGVADRFVDLTEPFYPPTTGRYYFLLSLLSFSGTATASKGDAQSPQMSIYVKDEGIAALNTGISNPLGGGGGGGPTPKVYTQKEIGFNAIRTYLGNGAYNRLDYGFQGQSPFGPNGNMRSWWWFDDSPGLLSDLATVTAGDMAYLDIFVYYDHWYYSSGGIAAVGWHNNAGIAPPGPAEPAGGFANIVNRGYGGRGIGQWFTLFGSSIQTAMHNGSFKGILLGPAGGGLNNYGYSSNIRIRAGYYK